MKWYIAARFDEKEKVREIHQLLAVYGHTITSDWTVHLPIKPYDHHERESREYSLADIDGVRESDIFVLLSDDAGTGMYVELGTAIASHLTFGKPLIYVVGEHSSRSMFYFHPSVKRRKTIEDVLGEIKET